jgi:hypothetical protein
LFLKGKYECPTANSSLSKVGLTNHGMPAQQKALNVGCHLI